MSDKTLAIKVELKGTEAQKKKLAALETEVKKLTNQRSKLNKQLKDGAINTKQFGAAIAKVNTGLKAHRRALLVTRQEMLGIDGFTTRLGKSFRKMGTSIVAGFAGMFAIQKIGQLFSNVTRIFKDFEQANANLASVLGTTVNKISALTEDAKRLGAATAFSATEVSKLQTEFAKLGFTEEQILNATEATLDLAAATGSDLSQAAAIAGATLGGFGLDAKDTQKVVDVMAKSFSTSALDIEKFRESMKFAAPAAKAVGVSVEETTALLGTLANAGISGSLAGTGLAKTFTKLNEAGLTLEQGLTQVRNSQNKLKTATELVGQTAAKSFLVLSEGTKTTKELRIGLENAGGAAKRMADTQLDTLEGKTKILNSAFEGLVLSLTSGDSAFASMAKGIVEATTNILGFLTPSDKLSESIDKQRANLFLLESELKDVNTSEGRRLEIIKNLQEEYPDFLSNVDAEKVSNEQLTTALRKVNDQLINRIIVERKKEEIDEQNNEIADARNDLLEEQRDALQKVADIEATLTKLVKDRQRINKNKQDIQIAPLPDDLNRIDQLRFKIDALNQVRDRQVQLSKEGQRQNVLDFKESNRLSRQISGLENRLVKIQKAQQNLNEEESIGNILLDEKAELLKEFGLETKKTTKETENSTEAINENADAINNVKFALVDLEEFDDDDIIPEVDENEVKKSTNALFLLADAIEKTAKTNRENKQKENELNAENLVDESRKKLDQELKDEKEALQFQKEQNKRKIDVAQQAANALVTISSQRFEREKNLELQALDDKVQQGLISQQDAEKQREAIERKAFQRQKRLQIAQIAISLATELANIAANSAGNPLNAFSAGFAGAAQNIALAKIAIARSAIQAGIVASQQFAEGGYTGSGFGSPDSSGFKQAGVVHEGEYVVPKNVLESQRGSSLVSALESMRTNRPQPFSNFGFANGGLAGATNIDMTNLSNEISQAVASSIGAIQVVNNATDTISQAAKVNNIQSEATFG
tara:strand:+ start:6574 stop:9555 length:2982 start_codon:yes stop_codon:yes gene_type:complete